MVLVSAAVLIDNENKFLLAQRPQGKPLPGLWEFPGGKVHKNELPEEALVRELREELGIVVAPGCLFPLTFVSYPYPEFHLLMPIYACRVWEGEVKPLEGQNLAWVNKPNCRKYKLPPADEQVLPSLMEMI
ncbi:MAG: (deoxy)nucleoside triphosphate pyrophosphohydrolase [Alphaproteobacteria bacterium]|nr:(deoxy)nucleoside triphosphate pyrophosphohydrolase [Alphaproteobacteria bacterium]